MFGSINAELNSRLPSSGGGPHVQDSLAQLVQDTVQFAQYDFSIITGHFVIHAHELQLETFLHAA